MNQMIKDTHNKINAYLDCLETQISFAGDCALGAEAILHEANKDEDNVLSKGFVVTAFYAFQNEVIMLLSKIFDNTQNDDVISISALKNILQKNKHCLSIEWQTDQYNAYCERHAIDDTIKQFATTLRFVSIENAINQLDIDLEDNSTIIQNITAHRDKYHGHNDKKYRVNKTFSDLYIDYPLNNDDVHIALNIAFDFVSRVSLAMGRDRQSEHSIVLNDYKNKLNLFI